jgi:hypothetical protein
MRPYYDIVQPIQIAALWFGSVFFAVSAFGSTAYAFIAAAGAMLLGLLGLAWLRHIGMDEAGAPLGVLWAIPFIIVACGVNWWIGQAIGLFG